MDFHSRTRKAVYGESLQSSESQDEGLRELSNAALQRGLSMRSKRMIMDFALNTNVDLRIRMYWHFYNKVFAEIKAFSIPRGVLWGRYSEVQFVLSPPGNGYDCHRTWEALALGAVPILFKAEKVMSSGSSKANELFEGLPVVMVESHEEITEEALDRWAREIEEKKRAGVFKMEKLLAGYWIHQFRA
jgi:hypothetical protein